MTLGSKKDNTDRRMEENDITELDDSLDDIEPVNSSSGLYEHFRVTVDKGGKRETRKKQLQSKAA